MDTVEVHVIDIEDLRYVLGACLNILQSHDLIEAQYALTGNRPSPLTLDVERVKTRFDGYLSDFLLARYEEENQDPGEGAENVSGELTEVSEEELSATPLGDFQPPKQEGRRLSAEELGGGEESEAE